MTGIVFDPALPWWAVAALAALAAAGVAMAAWQGLRGWWLRALAALAVLVALIDPSWRDEARDPLQDIVLVAVDETASNRVDVRQAQTASVSAAVAERLAELGADGSLRVETVRVREAEGADGADGTRLLTALAEAAADHAADRIAAALLITDGRTHDGDRLTTFPAPVHLLLTGRPGEWDRRLVVETAPAFSIVGEEVEVRLRVDETGDAPASGPVPLSISIDGGTPLRFEIPVGQTVALPLRLQHAGPNVVQVMADPAPGELTPRNNAAVLSINGVRDRLRVLLVSGEPYPGERTWRNLLKADSAVDLVHFTILRPPDKQDGVPERELSLIAFPTRELFLEKVDEFDLIIFDRYRRRGVLPSLYIENIADYVRRGGAVLVSTGPAFAGVESLYRTPLRDVLPFAPSGRVFEEGYLPSVSDTGLRHPVTAGLEADWGRWMRQIEGDALSGHTVMTGVDDAPLLVLDRVGEGRIAVLASDHAWLWTRGFEGGGPQLELLRRLAHWLMQEPELEEEALRAEADGDGLRLTRRTLEEEIGPVQLTGPDGAEITVEMVETLPGRFEGRIEAPADGLWRVAEGGRQAVAAIGPAAPREFENPISTAEILAPLVEATGGGALRVAEAVPQLRRVREGRVAAGRGWLGIPERGAYVTTDIRLTPLAPAWLMLALATLLAVAAWRRESR